MTASLTIGILVYQQYITQSQPAGMIAALRASGHRVTLLDPQSSSREAGNLTWFNKHDLIIAQGPIFGLLYRPGWVEMQGAAVMDRHASVRSAYSGADLTVAVANNTFSTSSKFPGQVHTLSCQVHDSCYSVIVNPIFSGKSNGLRVVQNPDGMAGCQWSEVTAHVKQYLPNHDCDLKLYGIGAQIWIVRKPSSFSPAASFTPIH